MGSGGVTNFQLGTLQRSRGTREDYTQTKTTTRQYKISDPKQREDLGGRGTRRPVKSGEIKE